MTDLTKPEYPDLASVWQGTFPLFGVNLRCHVLSDGSRIVEADSIRELFEAMSEQGVGNPEALDEFAKWMRGDK